MKYIILGLTLLISTCFQTRHSLLGIEVAKEEIKRALSDRIHYPQLPKKVITDKQTAIAVAEPVLFKIYGKKQILEQRPYEVYLIKGYWVLNGTLPEEMDGGGFVIVLNAKDSKVMRLTHYK